MTDSAFASGAAAVDGAVGESPGSAGTLCVRFDPFRTMGGDSRLLRAVGAAGGERRVRHFLVVDEVVEHEGEVFGVVPGQHQAVKQHDHFGAMVRALMSVEAEIEDQFLGRTSGAEHVDVRGDRQGRVE